MKTASPRLPCCFDHNCELGCTSQMYSGRVWKAERRCMPGPHSLCLCPTRKQGHGASDVSSPVMGVKIQLERCHWLGSTFQQALKGDGGSPCRSWLPGYPLASFWQSQKLQLQQWFSISQPPGLCKRPQVCWQSGSPGALF